MIEYMSEPSANVMAAARRRARRRAAASGSTEWPEFAPPVGLSSGPLGAVQAADREIARQTALRARAIAAFAATRPATVDRWQGEKGAMSPERWAARPEVVRSVSEWATPELMVAMSLTERAAETLLERSLTLVSRLPGTLTALEAGALHPGHLWCLLEHVAPIDDDRVRAEVEAELLRWMAGRVTSPAQLGAKARREVAKRDARAAARRLERAIRERGVFLRAEPVNGMASVTAVLTMPEAQALYRTLCALVDALDTDPDDGRTRGQKLADVLLDLVLRPGEGDRPPVQVLLTVVAAMGTLLGGDTPGEVEGHVVPAEMIRHLVRTMTGSQSSSPDADGVSAAAPEEAGGPDANAGEEESPGSAAWWAELEALFAGEPGDRPESVFERRLAAWLADLEPADFASEHPPAAEHPMEPDLREDAEPGEAASPPPGAAVGAPPGEGAAPKGSPEDGGWWASADRAVDDASGAVRAAVFALGHARRTVDTARVADARDQAAWAAGPAGRISRAETALEALAAAAAEQREQLAALLDTTGGGGLADRPRVALTDALTGTLLALSDLPGLRRHAHCGLRACRRRPESCMHTLTGRPGLGPPGPTDAYRPSAELDRFVRARDRRCRFPGCRRRVPRGGELDHDRPYPDGPTSAENLNGFCTTHHRGKHQAPGWQHELASEGALTVTTPTGLTVTTEPPPY